MIGACIITKAKWPDQIRPSALFGLDHDLGSELESQPQQQVVGSIIGISLRRRECILIDLELGIYSFEAIAHIDHHVRREVESDARAELIGKSPIGVIDNTASSRGAEIGIEPAYTRTAADIRPDHLSERHVDP